MIFVPRDLIRCALLAVGIAALAGGAFAKDRYAPRTDWIPRDAKLNLSSFLYLDRNENGEYDLGDRPLSGIAVAMYYEGKEVIATEANANGFANFPASRVQEDREIHRLGTYGFKVLPPPGWRITSGNGYQEREFVDLQGSVMGGVFEDMMVPVGLVPPKEIRGRTDPGTELVLSGTGFEARDVSVDDEGRFTVTVPRAGLYTLTTGGDVIDVPVDVFPVDLGTLRGSAGTMVSDRTVSFEDVSGNELRKVPNGYSGLNWFNLNAIHNTFTRGAVGYVNGVTSGTYSVYTSSGHPAEIKHSEGFDVITASATLAWPWAEGETMRVEYYRGEDMVAVDRVTLSAYHPVVYMPRITDVTRMRIITEHYWQMVIDDVAVAGGE